MHTDLQGTWEQAREKMKQQMTDSSYQTWILPVLPVEMNENRNLILFAPSKENENMLRDFYYNVVWNAIREVDSSIQDVLIIRYARAFYKRFVQMTKDQIPLSLYKGDGHSFTMKITGLINTIISDFFKLEHQNEYYRIDAIGWKQRKEEVSARANAVGLNPCLWDMKIAVEHENDVADWTDELIKLAHIRCDLKVIIGYSRYDEREEKEREKLSYAADCLRLAHVLDDAAKESYLIILGNARSQDNNYQSFDYRGYIYKYEKEKFERV